MFDDALSSSYLLLLIIWLAIYLIINSFKTQSIAILGHFLKHTEYNCLAWQDLEDAISILKGLTYKK